jgi:RHS repeat-associated protein
VEYYNGTTLIGEVFTAPYSMTWQNVPPGTHSLTAKMVSAGFGWVTESTVVNVTVTVTEATLHFIEVDHLNTPRLVANQSGQTVWRWDQQEPFGVNVPDENPSGLGAFELPLRFAGQYFDQETNLHYNYFRDYDPALGRYVESDPIGLLGGLNTYAYVQGSPVKLTDRLGLLDPLQEKLIKDLSKKAWDEVLREPVNIWAGTKCATDISCAVFRSRFRQTSIIDACTSIITSAMLSGVEVGPAIAKCVTECWDKLTEKCKNNPNACLPGADPSA